MEAWEVLERAADKIERDGWVQQNGECDGADGDGDHAEEPVAGPGAGAGHREPPGVRRGRLSVGCGRG